MKQSTFIEGKIFSPLIRFAFPVLIALFLQTMYGAVDLMIVGQFGGALADVYVSAVSTGSQIMQTLTVIITGLAMGLTVFVGKKIGADQKKEAGEIIGSGICLFGFLSLLLSVGMILCAPFLSNLMQAPQAAFHETTAYIFICSCGTIFIVAYNLIGSVFRGIGNSKIPLYSVAIACIFNIGGDLLFVAGFNMGAKGAAIATVLAQAISVLLSYVIIKKIDLPFSFSMNYIKPKALYIKETLKLGIPIALQDLLVSISFLFIIAIVNSLGLTPSAGVGVAEKLCGFLMLVPSAYMQSMSAFVAQNIGAKKPDRAKKALWYGIASSVVVGLFMAYLTYFHGEILSGIFAKDPKIILASTEYLKAYAWDCILTSFLFCFIGYFNGLGKTTFVMVQGIIGAFAVRLPLSWIMSKQVPVSLYKIGLATPASSVVQILLCFGFFILCNKKLHNSTLKEANL